MFIIKLNYAYFFHAVVFFFPTFSQAAGKLFFTGVFGALKAEINAFFPVAGFSLTHYRAQDVLTPAAASGGAAKVLEYFFKLGVIFKKRIHLFFHLGYPAIIAKQFGKSQTQLFDPP